MYDISWLVHLETGIKVEQTIMRNAPVELRNKNNAYTGLTDHWTMSWQTSSVRILRAMKMHFLDTVGSGLTEEFACLVSKYLFKLRCVYNFLGRSRVGYLNTDRRKCFHFREYRKNCFFETWLSRAAAPGRHRASCRTSFTAKYQTKLTLDKLKMG